MTYRIPHGGNWIQGTPKIRSDGQWVPVGSALPAPPTERVETTGRGFNWDQTHADTQWLFDADDNDNITVETVTNLDASGSGSFDSALSAAESNDNTVIVFEVGGVIDNEGDTYIRSFADDVYIAGQTAPYPGVTLIRGGIRIHGNNTILQHMTFLPGDDVDDPHKSRAFTFDGGVNNCLADHCSFGWSPDTNTESRRDCSNLAIINSINAEALNYSSHPEAPHGYGTLIAAGTTEFTILGNLYTHNWKRNPMCNRDGVNFCFINNYVYNWGARHFHGSSSEGPEMDWIGNVSDAGNNTRLDEGIFNDRVARMYYDDQILIPSDHPLEDERITYVNSPQHLPDGLDLEEIVPANRLEDFIIQTVGPRPANRDPFTQRIINDFTNRSGEIIDHHDDVGGYPDYDTQTRSLNPPETDVLDWLQQYTNEAEGVPQ